MTASSSTILDGIALSQLAYEPLNQQISTTALNSAVSNAAALGWQLVSRTELGQGGLLGAAFFNGEYKYDGFMGQAYIAMRGTEIALVFEGTAGPFGAIAEWITDATLPATIEAQYLQYAFIVNVFKQFVAGFGPTKAYVFGHSLGGAMAEMFMRSNPSSIYEAVTFGSPGDFSGGSDPRITNFEHSADPVAALNVPILYSSGDVVNVLLPEDLGLFGEHLGGRYYDSVQMLHESGLFGQVGSRQIVAGNRFLSDSIDFSAQSGSFLILGGGGGDTLHGGSGSDLISGGSSSDTLFGEGGNDSIFGGDLHDSIFGGQGSDTLFGEAHEDVLRGEAGADTIYGGSGWDTLYGDEGDDFLKGELGNDSLRGGVGNDRLFGDEGDDRLIGEAGNDVLDGGSGINTAVFARAFQAAGGTFNYQLTSLGGGRYSVRDLAGGSPEGTDTLERIEFITFGTQTLRVAEWIALAGGTPPPSPPPNVITPYIPPDSDPTPVPTTNPLLSVTPVNRQLVSGQSVALGDLFPRSSWVDGASDIVRFAVQDRSAGGGFLTYNGRVVEANRVYEMAISELANWRFVAGAGASTDQIGFNIIQTDGDYSPRLTTGAVVTTVLPVVVNPVVPTPIVVPGTEIARLDLDLRNGSSGNEGDSAQFTIQRRGNQDGDIVVEWRIEGIGANPADRRDFPAMSGTVTLYDGRGDRNFSIGLTQDQVDELNETFRIELRVVSGNAVLDDDDANFTIIDDDVPLGIDPNVDDHGNSFATATVVAEDRWARGFIEQPGDQDYFRFDLLGGVGYEFILVKDRDLSLIGGDPDADYPTLPQPITELFNSSGQLIATLPATSLSSRWAFQFETPADGTYYMRVRENGDNDVGQYFVLADIQVRADDYSANASTTAQLVAGEIITGRHERDADVDWIAVDLQAGETYRTFVAGPNRLLLDGAVGALDGGNGWYYFGWDSSPPGVGFRVVDENGNTIAQRISGYPTSSNLLEFTVTQNGRYFISVDGTTGRMPNYVVGLDSVNDRPVEPALVLQPGADQVDDFRFAGIRTSNNPPIDDDILTVDHDTTSAIRFDLSGHSSAATYAAVEVFLFASGSAITGDIAVDVPLNMLDTSSTFREAGSLEFLTAVQTSGVGQWVTIEITDLYNQWISGDRANNGIMLTATEFNSAVLSFYSSNYSADPSLRPRLVLDGPDIVATVYGQTTVAIAEDGLSISGLIGLTGSGAGFANAFAVGNWGTISVDATGQHWTYELDARSEALRAGQVVTENLTITSGSGVSQAVSVTITGQDDVAVVVGSGPHQLAEAIRTLSGRAAIADIDSLAAPTFVSASHAGAYGLFSVSVDGTWTYTLSNAGVLALGSGTEEQERISLQASDGTMIEFVFMVTGTDNDVLLGTVVSEAFSAGIGNDLVYGGAGNDSLAGDAGSDQLWGGAGADAHYGGSDTGIDFARYDEAVYGGMVIRLDTSNLNTGAAAGDTYSGIEGLVGGAGNDSVYGNGLNNYLFGSGGADQVYGQAGNDYLSGDAGGDNLWGGTGADAHYGGSDAGIDYARYDDANYGNLVIRLDTSASNTGAAAGDTYTGIEGLVGGAGNDSVYGDGLRNFLFGSGGADHVYGGAGSDYLSGDAGGDNLWGGTGADQHIGGNDAGVDYARYDDANHGNLLIRLDTPASNTGAAAGDTYTGIEGLVGGAGNDSVYGDGLRNFLFGSGGADHVYGGAGNDYLSGDAGGDNLWGGAGADQHIGGNDAGVDYARYDDANHGNLTIRLDAPAANAGAAAVGDTYTGIEGLVGGAGADVVIGNAAANFLFGQSGADFIDGLGGSDYLNGGAGADRFRMSTALGAGNVDTIADFQHLVDDILLLSSVFSAIGVTLTADEFRVGTAVDANDFILYNSATGALTYDSNGSGAGGATQFATLTAGLTLTFDDFIMV